MTTKTLWRLGLVALAALTQSCSDGELRNEMRQANHELRQANDELRQENRGLRDQVATLDKQLAQQQGRIAELQRAVEPAVPKPVANPIVAPAEPKGRSETEAGVRAEQVKQQTVATLKKLAAQMDRLLDEIPGLESNLAAWDLAMPVLLNLYKEASLQMNLLAAELDGLKFEHREAVRQKITGFSTGYQGLPGIGRIVVSSRERVTALRAQANPSEADLDAATREEVTMAAQLSVFNATLAECKRLRTEVSKLAD